MGISTTVVRHNITHNHMRRIVDKAAKKHFEFIAVSHNKEEDNYNVVAARKMWNKDVSHLFDLGRNTVIRSDLPTIKGDSMSKSTKNPKSEKVAKPKIDFSELSSKSLFKSAFKEEVAEEAINEVTKRIKRVQSIYSVYNPDDKFLKKGDMNDLTAEALVKVWDDNEKSKSSVAVLSWLVIDEKIQGSF